MTLVLLRRTGAAFFLAVLCSACAGRAHLNPGEIPSPPAPTAEERTTAEAYVNQHLSENSYDRITSGPGLARCKKVVARLEKAAGFRPKTLEVELVDAGDEVNAVTINSAAVVVYKKLLDKVPDDTDLAVVLAHEIGHAVGRHSQEKGLEERAEAVSVGSTILGVAASVATSLSGFGGLSSSVGDLTSNTSAALGYGAFVGAYDRDQEYEADHLGLLIMAKAGYNPEAAPRFWERADEVFGSSESQLEAFFSTHPAPSDRIDALREALPLALPLYEKARH